jgi:hypothetical protein
LAWLNLVFRRRTTSDRERTKNAAREDSDQFILVAIPITGEGDIARRWTAIFRATDSTVAWVADARAADSAVAWVADARAADSAVAWVADAWAADSAVARVADAWAADSAVARVADAWAADSAVARVADAWAACTGISLVVQVVFVAVWQHPRKPASATEGLDRGIAFCNDSSRCFGKPGRSRSQPGGAPNPPRV